MRKRSNSADADHQEPMWRTWTLDGKIGEENFESSKYCTDEKELNAWNRWFAAGLRWCSPVTWRRPGREHSGLSSLRAKKVTDRGFESRPEHQPISLRVECKCLTLEPTVSVWGLQLQVESTTQHRDADSLLSNLRPMCQRCSTGIAGKYLADGREAVNVFRYPQILRRKE